MFGQFALPVRSSMKFRGARVQDGGHRFEREFPMVNTLRVNGGRLWSRLMQMAEIGATPHGGCNRQALTDADMAGRKLLTQWAEQAGCRVRVDAVGNLFIRRAGGYDTLPVVRTGSHLHTHPTAAKFYRVSALLARPDALNPPNH